jgi:hypothetical protein
MLCCLDEPKGKSGTDLEKSNLLPIGEEWNGEDLAPTLL